MLTRHQIDELIEAVEGASGELLDMVKPRLLELLSGDLITDALLWRAKGPARFKQVAAKMQKIEAEFDGTPFWSLVRDFAERGHSRHETAKILGLDVRTLRRMEATCGPRNLPWPQGTSNCKAWQERKVEVTPRMHQAMVSNLRKAVACSANARRRLTEEVLGLAAALHERGLVWTAVMQVLQTQTTAKAIPRALLKYTRTNGEQARQRLLEQGLASERLEELYAQGVAWEQANGYSHIGPDHPWRKGFQKKPARPVSREDYLTQRGSANEDAKTRCIA